MTEREAIEIFNKWLDCKDAYQADPSCDGKCLSCEYYASAEEEKEAMQMAVAALKKQEQDRWVPVSERPKKDGRYQVTRLDYVTNTEFIDILWYEENLWWNRHSTGDYAVTAWMPLPEPYLEEGEADGRD